MKVYDDLPFLDAKQIRKDNPHFEGDLIFKHIEPYKSKEFDFIALQLVACTGNNAQASYLWSPSQNNWVLGAN